jgi:methylmalonyl-CoA mutase
MFYQVVDPFGGSFLIEALTADLHDKAKAMIDEIEQMGGMAKAVVAGN